jgi:AcrR family transcriptional regulator
MCMERNLKRVKPPRGYDSRRRREQAEKTRADVVDVAKRLFLRDGYAKTTIAAVAAGARVSVETVYKSFGGKPGLIRAICGKALAGEGPIHAETRSDELKAREADPRRILLGFGTLSTEVAPRVSPILLLVRSAAAANPEAAGLETELDERRMTRMRHNARTLLEAGHLRRGISLEDASEVMWTYSSPDLYDVLVRKLNWPPARYGRFIADAMIAALLPPEGRANEPARRSTRSRR